MPEIKDSKRTVLERIGSTLDSLISVVAPTAAMRRQAARQALRHLREYAAAKTTRMTGAWAPVTSGDVNDILKTDIVAIRARVRQLTRDFPVFANAVSKVTDYTVGPGMSFQSKLKKKRGKDLDSRRNSLIEDLWKQWSMNATIDGRMNLSELARLCRRAETEDGEFLLIKRYPKDQIGRAVPFALQIISPEWLISDSVTVPAGNDILMGIEFNKSTGAIVNYHIRDPKDYVAKATVIPANQVIHGFETLRPGQLRGVSPMVAGVILADAMNEFIGAEVDAAKLMAKVFAFVEADNLAEYQGARNYETDEADSTKRLDDIENGIIEYLRPGQKINFNTAGKNGSNLDKFTEIVLRMISLCTGLSYEIVAGDYRGLNFTTIRGARNDMIKTLRPTQERFIAQFYLPIYKEFLDMAFLKGVLPQPMYNEYLAAPFTYLSAARFMAPGIAMIDPLRESRAQVEQKDNLLMSPHELAMERGRDPEDILDEFVEWEAMKKERGLAELSTVEMNMSTNPGTIMEDGDNDKE